MNLSKYLTLEQYTEIFDGADGSEWIWDLNEATGVSRYELQRLLDRAVEGLTGQTGIAITRPTIKKGYRR